MSNNYNNSRAIVITEWLVPDLAVLVASLTVFFTVRRAVSVKQDNVEQGDGLPTTASMASDTASAGTRRGTSILIPNFDRLINICKCSNNNF